MIYSNLPERLKPTERFNSVNELFFDKLNSSWRIASATSNVGRSRTLSFIHYSEVAFFHCSLADLQKSIQEAAIKDALCIYETTANGFNHARALWLSGSCHNLFYGWWRTAEYRCRDYAYLEAPDARLAARLRLLEEMGLDREQRCWYAKKYAGYLDKSLIQQEYPCTPEEAFISSGECVFDKEALHAQLIRLAKEPRGRVGYFRYKKVGRELRGTDGEIQAVEWTVTDIEFVEAADGYITLHEEPRLRLVDGVVTARAPYALGGDTAGSGADYYTGKVISVLDHRSVATLRKQRIDEDLYTEQMYCLGRYYHDALIGIETNYSRQPMRLLASKYRYPNLYMRQRVDRMTDTVEKVYGFETTAKTKPIIISELVERIREDPSLERDEETIREMLVFVKKENGRQEAQDGMHDDLVMADAIAHFISGQVRAAWIPVDTGEKDFIANNFHPEEPSSGFMDW